MMRAFGPLSLSGENMYRYELSLIGPLPESWWAANGLNPTVFYGGGSLTIFKDSVNGPWSEYPIAVMDGISWGRFNHWANKFTSESVLNLEEIEEAYVAYSKYPINWVLDAGGAKQYVTLTEPSGV